MRQEIELIVKEYTPVPDNPTEGLVEEIRRYFVVNVPSGPATDGDSYEQGFNDGQVRLGEELEKILTRHAAHDKEEK